MVEMNRRNFLNAAAFTGLGLGLSNVLGACSKGAKFNINELYPIYKNGQYQEKNFEHLTKNDKLGLSPEIIKNHLGLYSNYVKNVNQAEAEMAVGNITEFGMKHLAFSLNGMALHDIYFTNMSTEESKRSSSLNRAIDKTFGSFDAYMKNLTELAMKVEGWSVTGLNLLNGKIFNYALQDHSANFPNFIVPILALDVYEHAYVADFKKEGKAKYLETFTKIIDWDIVSRRLDLVKNLV